MRRTGMFLRLELFVDDLDAAVAFYRDGLGFIVSRRDPDYAVMSQGQVTLGLGLKSGVSVGHYFAPEITTERRGLGTEIVLEVDDVQAAYDAFVDAGYTAMGTPTERSWGLTDFRVADPDGYFVRITSR
jgi:catechol 2,3-dioxygenase-like lactoylglutathione lyase family enzyme